MTPLQALQNALAGEHAAVYVYGVIGGRVPRSAAPALAAQVSTAYTTHRARRDQLTTMVRAAGGEPVAAEVSYQLPNDARSLRELRVAALGTEQRCAAVYADTVGSTARANRQFAIDALVDSAVRQLGLGSRAVAYPGIPEL